MSVCKLLQRSCLKQQPFAREEGRLSVFAHVNLSTQSFWMHLWGEKYSPGSPMSLVSQKPIPNNHTLIQRAHRVELCCAAGSTGLFVSSQNSFHASFQRLGYTVHTYTHTHSLIHLRLTQLTRIRRSMTSLNNKDHCLLPVFHSGTCPCNIACIWTPCPCHSLHLQSP